MSMMMRSEVLPVDQLLRPVLYIPFIYRVRRAPALMRTISRRILIVGLSTLEPHVMWLSLSNLSRIVNPYR
jgi:hypothetical protein